MDRDAELFQSLAEPTRLRLLHILQRTDGICVCELGDALRVPQYNISRHLHALLNAGWLEGERCGKWIYYRISARLRPCQRRLLEAVEMLGRERQDFKQDEARTARRLKLRSNGSCCVGLVAKIGTVPRATARAVER